MWKIRGLNKESLCVCVCVHVSGGMVYGGGC